MKFEMYMIIGILLFLITLGCTAKEHLKFVITAVFLVIVEVLVYSLFPFIKDQMILVHILFLLLVLFLDWKFDFFIKNVKNLKFSDKHNKIKWLKYVVYFLLTVIAYFMGWVNYHTTLIIDNGMPEKVAFLVNDTDTIFIEPNRYKRIEIPVVDDLSVKYNDTIVNIRQIASDSIYFINPKGINTYISSIVRYVTISMGEYAQFLSDSTVYRTNTDRNSFNPINYTQIYSNKEVFAIPDDYDYLMQVPPKIEIFQKDEMDNDEAVKKFFVNVNTLKLF